MINRSSHASVAPVAYLLGALLVASISASALALAIGVEREPLASMNRPQLEFVRAEMVSSDGKFPVTVAIEEVVRRAITVGRSGVVTGISLESLGEMPSSGDGVIQIDDSQLVASYGPAPIWGEVDSSSPPSLVERAQRLLRSMYPEVRTTGEWDWATASAAQRFRGAIGLDDDLSSFPGEQTVWLGQSPSSIHSVLVHVGDRVVAGDRIADGPVVDANVVVSAPSSTALDDRTGWVLDLGQVDVPIDASLQVSGESVDLVANLISDSGSPVPATVRRTEAVESIRVPVTAVKVEGTEACVFEQRGRSDYRPREVEVVSSGNGAAEVVFVSTDMEALSVVADASSIAGGSCG